VFLKGWDHYRRRTPGDFAKAVGYFERAVELDPQYGRAYAAMANIYWKSWLWTVQTDSQMFLPWTRPLNIPIVHAPDRADEFLQKAMRNPNALAHQVASEMRLYDRRFGTAISEAERAITLNPNDPAGYVAMGQALIFAGRAEEAVQFIERATRLDPHSAVNLYLLGLVRFSAAQLDQAVTLFERALERSPFNKEWNIPLTAAYAHVGRDRAAQVAMGNFGGGLLTVGNIMENWPFKDAGVAERFGSGLVKAGMCCELDVEDYVARVRQGEKP
jgi:tetratricopeptide (TPR) repeat protein